MLAEIFSPLNWCNSLVADVATINDAAATVYSAPTAFKTKNEKATRQLGSLFFKGE
jgi:hypothetical protein